MAGELVAVGGIALKGHTFRPDVEAMRAISIAGVLLFHAGVPGFAGGFVGVDIFFLISGFLITGLLLREREATGRIDLVGFWMRRAWRLLPNAILVLSAVLLLSWLSRPFGELKTVSADVGAALFYLANYRFAFRAVDYFDNAQAASPVLHFWSLGVEEQFYLVWPFLLVLVCWRAAGAIRTRAFVTVTFLGVASFAVSLVWLGSSQPAAFFHTEARVWQLASGAMLAILGPRAVVRGSWREPARWAGLMGVAASFGLLSEDAYPGVRALLPVASAALLIACGEASERTGVARALAAAPVQWVGRRSYSIYLWHWPLLLFASPLLSAHALGTVAAIALVLVVAAAAFALVEDPLRRRGARRQPVASALGAPFLASACVGLFALAGWYADRLEPAGEHRLAERIAQAANDGPRIASSSGCTALVGDDQRTGCRYGSPAGVNTVVLFGDSYAEHLFDGVDQAAREAGWSMLIWTRASCPPVDAPSIDSAKRVVDTGCLAWREAALRRLIVDRPQLVVVSSWAGAATSIADGRGRPLERDASQTAWRLGFARVLNRLREAGLEVAVVRGTPRGAFAQLHSCLPSATRDGCGRPRVESVAYSAADHQVAMTVPGVRLIDLTDHFCGPNVCYSVRNDVIVYRDRSHHLTGTFARSLAPAFSRLMQARE